MAKTMRRRSSKGTRKAKRNKNKNKNSWPMFVKKVYHEEHKKNKNYTFKEALKKASLLKKQGKMM
tara:strand:- start:820 stop:1014 length:195 start_codon:yes stop_codon:yes gene_type:complete